MDDNNEELKRVLDNLLESETNKNINNKNKQNNKSALYLAITSCILNIFSYLIFFNPDFIFAFIFLPVSLILSSLALGIKNINKFVKFLSIANIIGIIVFFLLCIFFLVTCINSLSSCPG